ncbi:T6SS effector BTH_I2691 family protein [Halomonas sp. S2151]|nr:T6SS effector BTH_I2691 family protein [Halomonas sp. S2151]
MSKKNQRSIAECPYCEKKGLPVLPLRYAVARTDVVEKTQAPRLDYPFGVGVEDVELPEGQVYTLRLLRPGYLYVYHEVRSTWSGYLVTPMGFLYPYVLEIDHDVLVAMNPNEIQGGIDALLQPPSKGEEITCKDNPEHHYPGRCITILDPENGGDVYFAYSETAWTKRVWHEHATNAHVGEGASRRRDQMRCISLSDWRGIPAKYGNDKKKPLSLGTPGGKGKHAAPLRELSDRLAESRYPWSRTGIRDQQDDASWPPPTSLGSSVSDIIGVQGQIDGLIEWAEIQANADDMLPMMVALDDPAGITYDLASLMTARTKQFLESPEHRWQVVTASMINGVEEAIRERAITEVLERARERADRTYDQIQKDRAITQSSGGPGWESTPALDEYYSREAIRERNYDAVESEYVKQCADDAWAKYDKMLARSSPGEDDGPTMMERWEREEFGPAKERFEREVMAPLGDAYKKWLKSKCLLVYLEANHDDSDTESGVAFAATVARCLADTQQYKTLHDQYVAWLSSVDVSRDNLLLRGLLVDSSKLKSEMTSSINNIDVSHGDVISLPWQGVIAAYLKVFEDLPEHKGTLGRLLAAIISPYVKLLKDEPTARTKPAFLLLGMIAERPIVKISVNDATLRMVVADLRKSMGEVNRRFGNVDAEIFDRRMLMATRHAAEISGAVGGRGNYRVSYDYYKILDVADAIDDQGAIRAASASLMSEPVSQHLSHAALTGSAWGALANRNIQLSIVSMIIGGTTLLFQANTIFEATDAKSKFLIGSKLIAITAGTVGAAFELGHALLSRRALFGGRLQIWESSRLNSGLLGGVRVFGSVSAFLFSGLDFYATKNALERGQNLEAFLYFCSSLAGGASFLLITFVSRNAILATITVPGWGWILAGIAVAVNIALFIVVKDSLQHWIRRSYFGVDRNHDGFADFKSQTEAMKELFD